MNFISRYQDGAYLQRTEDWHEGDAAWKAAHVAAILREAGLSPRRIADAGCGTGGVLVQLRSMLSPGVEMTGFEIAEPAFRIADGRSANGLRFVHGSVEEYRGEPFHLMLAMDVFEHVPDYLGFLERVRPHARAFAFHIPLDLSVKSMLTGLPMHRRRSVGHLHYFSQETACATLEDSGYRIRATRLTHAVMQPPPTTWKQKLRRAPDRLLYAAGPERCARLLGGCSLLALAEPA